MPRYLIPRKSGVHRVACFALFRALLRQVKQLPLTAQSQEAVSDQIRIVIKRNVQLQSPTKILEALRLGSETLGALGSKTEWQNTFKSALDEGAQKLEQQQQVGPKTTPDLGANKKTRPRPNVGRPRVWPLPNASKTLDRPYLALSGRRHVPTLVNANRVPFLRLKKPQSPYISRIIRNIIETRERRLALAERLIDQISITQTEDEWDAILFTEFGLEDNASGCSWSHEVQLALDENRQLQTKAVQRRVDIAARMHSIVEQEKQLAVEEHRNIQKEKRKRILIRRIARRAETIPVAEHDRTTKSIGTTPKEAASTTVYDMKNFKPGEELKNTRTENTRFRTDEEIAEIKAARVRRKEEKANAKAQKAKRKAENVRLWQTRLNQQNK